MNVNHNRLSLSLSLLSSKSRRARAAAFTIVELLIVIVIIAILAAITIVAYNGMQARARDSIRKNDLATIKKALIRYEIDNGNYVETGSGCGYNGNGSGWFSLVDGGQYIKSVSNCLKEDGYIQKDFFDPTGSATSSPTSGYAYMKYTCGSGENRQVYVFAKLETVPQSATAIDVSCGSSLDTSYGMNYYLQVR